MAILDASIAWWKGGSDVAPHSPDQITEAIAFFENLTEIYSGSMSFIGPIRTSNWRRRDNGGSSGIAQMVPN
jgi:hypothetical protein